MQADIRRIAYDASRERIGEMTFDQFCDALSDWRFVPIESHEDTVGVVMTKDGEVHVSILEPFRRKGEVSRLADVFRKCAVGGKVTTVVKKGDEFRANLAMRFGFKKVQTSETLEYYEVCDEDLSFQKC